MMHCKSESCQVLPHLTARVLLRERLAHPEHLLQGRGVSLAQATSKEKLPNIQPSPAAVSASRRDARTGSMRLSSAVPRKRTG